MHNANEITILRDEYSSQEEFENAIKKAVMVLLDNNYIMTVRYDDKGLGIVVIEYNHSDRALGSEYPYWLSVEEFESIYYENDNEELGDELDDITCLHDRY